LTEILGSGEIQLSKHERTIIQNEIKDELAKLFEKIGREPSKVYNPGKDTTTWR
jgi:ribosome maturation protein Sdo1